MRRIILLLFLNSFVLSAFGQDLKLPLWEGMPPLQSNLNSEEERTQEGILRISKVQIPEIEVYFPTKQIQNGQAVLILPGGGYRILAYDWEGSDFAKWFNSEGITGIVLKYRLPDPKSQSSPEEVPLLDAQRAIRLVRHHAKEWGIDPDKIGVMGFSAGGHLASTLSTQYELELDLEKDDIDKLSARPDFSILVYPVISFRDASTHSGSKEALIGKNPSIELQDRFSAEINVTDKTPSTFLVHAQDDMAVPVRNSILYYQSLVENGVPATMHLYPSGGHGFAFGIGKGTVENWRMELISWLKNN
ncbi:alpha/beta hydrolase [Algoriphagus sediminis]|uniref:Alpha/beta hydrolase n=1 Tax=Algoriphagus sediminis TaxID=3057113 RepID=A0ABT7Y7M6_9BACT|nr:alpha/beta hydrolase [Algoriphagus sediminis]MDN3202518.1 alpha/beta hydrolase [Algoriphagus sediminis]